MNYFELSASTGFLFFFIFLFNFFFYLFSVVLKGEGIKEIF